MQCAPPSDPRPGQEVPLRLTIPGTTLAVREALVRLLADGAMRGWSPSALGTAEIVLAEALNNVVEHAYAQERGEIEVILTVGANGLVCTIIDQGRPMPGEVLPAGDHPAGAGETDLPEGGFGWFLIRSLACDLNYRRVQNRNEFRFRLCAEQ